MSRRIVTVTAVHAPAARHLPDAWRSLREQELPGGWQWHWVIQEDGTTEDVLPYVPDDFRVTFRQGRPGGPGVRPPLALAHVEGTYVKALEADQGLGWATSRVLDLLPDGSTVGFPGGPATRRPCDPATRRAGWWSAARYPTVGRPTTSALPCTRRPSPSDAAC